MLQGKVCDCDVIVVHCSIVHVESDKAIFFRGFGWCYFLSVQVETKCNNSPFFVHTDRNLQFNLAISCPYGCKFTAKFRYFPSLWMESSEIQRLISLHTDGNQALNCSIFHL